MTTLTLEEYARHILAENDCNEYTYGGPGAEDLLDDLKEIYTPDKMLYPYIDVANAILAISHPKPIKKSPYRIIVDMGDYYGPCRDMNTYEEAVSCFIECYMSLMGETMEEWKDIDNPTFEEKEDWNCMIDECVVSIERYNPKTDEYEEVHDKALDAKLEEIGWRYYL